jgi:hypothetical protein
MCSTGVIGVDGEKAMQAVGILSVKGLRPSRKKY